MSHEDKEFKRYADVYDPIRIGSIDGTDTEPHDRALIRALNSEYNPNKLVKGNPQYTIFVGRLNPRTTQETVKQEFSKFGKIFHCRLVKDIVTGKSKQYAFVEFDSHGAVEGALREMHHEYIEGAQVVVDRVAARRLRGWKPRRLGGGFGGRKEAGQLRFGCKDRPWRLPIVCGEVVQCVSMGMNKAVCALSVLMVVFVVSTITVSIMQFIAAANNSTILTFQSVSDYEDEVFETEPTK